MEKITKEHGHLSDEKLQDLEPDLRREIQEAFLKKDLMIGSSVIALVHPSLMREKKNQLDN